MHNVGFYYKVMLPVRDVDHAGAAKSADCVTLYYALETAWKYLKPQQ